MKTKDLSRDEQDCGVY